MEQMTQELNMENHNIKTVKKLYNEATTQHILNTYTMLDIEDGKKHVFSSLMKKYNLEIKNISKSLWKQVNCCWHSSCFRRR